MGSVQGRPYPRLHVTHRLLITFAATILLPGILLGLFGFKALLQERRLADQQIRERLQSSAETIGRRLELELLAWQQAAEQIIQAGEKNPMLWPARVRMATEEAGSLVVLLGDKKQVRALPASQVLYNLLPTPETPSHAALLAEAESLEMREKKYEIRVGTGGYRPHAEHRIRGMKSVPKSVDEYIAAQPMARPRESVGCKTVICQNAVCGPRVARVRDGDKSSTWIGKCYGVKAGIYSLRLSSASAARRSVRAIPAGAARPPL